MEGLFVSRTKLRYRVSKHASEYPVLSCFPDCSFNQRIHANCGESLYSIWECSDFNPKETVFFGEFVSASCDSILGKTMRSFELAVKLINRNIFRGYIRRYVSKYCDNSSYHVKVIYDPKNRWLLNLADKKDIDRDCLYTFRMFAMKEVNCSLQNDWINDNVDGNELNNRPADEIDEMLFGKTFQVIGEYSTNYFEIDIDDNACSYLSTTSTTITTITTSSISETESSLQEIKNDQNDDNIISNKSLQPIVSVPVSIKLKQKKSGNRILEECLDERNPASANKRLRIDHSSQIQSANDISQDNQETCQSGPVTSCESTEDRGRTKDNLSKVTLPPRDDSCIEWLLSKQEKTRKTALMQRWLSRFTGDCIYSSEQLSKTRKEIRRGQQELRMQIRAAARNNTGFIEEKLPMTELPVV